MNADPMDKTNSERTDQQRHSAEHQNTKGGDEQINNGMCNPKFFRPWETSNEKPFECDVCRTCFKLRGHLERHKRTHTGEKPFKCDICGKCLNQRTSLVYHKRCHTGEKPFKCDICGRCCRSKSNLKVHKRIHTDETPFKCDICGNTYKHRLILTIHKRNHTAKKLIERQSCGKYFDGKWNLLRQQEHNDKFFFEGEICKNIFHANLKLENKKIGVGDSPHNGNRCQKGFSTESKLTNHRNSSTALTSSNLNAFSVRSQSQEASTSRQEFSSEITSACNVPSNCVSDKLNLLLTGKSPSMEEPHERGFTEKVFECGNSEPNEIPTYENVSEMTIFEKKDISMFSQEEKIGIVGDPCTSGNYPKISFSEGQLIIRGTRNGEASIGSQDIIFRKEKSADDETLHDVDGLLKNKKHRKCLRAEVQLPENAESHFVEYPYICIKCRSGFHEYADMKQHALTCSNKKLKG